MCAFSGGLYFIGEYLTVDRRATSSLFMYSPLDSKCCVETPLLWLVHSWCFAADCVVLFCSRKSIWYAEIHP